MSAPDRRKPKPRKKPLARRTYKPWPPDREGRSYPIRRKVA